MRYEYIVVQVDARWDEIIVSRPHFSWHVYHNPTASSVRRAHRYGQKYANGKIENDGFCSIYHIIRKRKDS